MVAELILANVAYTVVIQRVNVSALVGYFGSVSAGGCVPVLIVSGRPSSLISMLVLSVVAAYGTNSVVIKSMIFYSIGFNKMSAGCLKPVSRFITCPLGCRELVSTVLIVASLAKSILVSVNVSGLVSGSNSVIAACFVPVIGCIIGPLVRVGMLVSVVPSASVTVAVVVLILVRSLVSYGSVVKTGNCVPVILGILRPIGRIRVRMTVIITASRNVTHAVVV